MIKAEEQIPGDKPATDIGKLSFEEALATLEEIIRALETGRLKLEEAVSAYEKGELLRKHCEKKLQEAELRAERITAAGQEEKNDNPKNDCLSSEPEKQN